MTHILPCKKKMLGKWTSIGPFTFAKTKIQKTWFFVVPFTLPEKPITFGVFGTEKRMREKTRISYLFLVSGAHARLLSTFDRTRVVRITSRAAVGWSAEGHVPRDQKPE